MNNVPFFFFVFSENLDKLEEMVVPLFGNIKNRDAKKLKFSYDYHPWGPEQLKYKTYIVPLEDMRSLRLYFPVPDYQDQYKTSVSWDYCIIFRRMKVKTVFQM